MAAMSHWQVNSAEAAIYGLSAAGLLLCIVAAFFTWASLQKSSHEKGGRAHHTPAE